MCVFKIYLALSKFFLLLKVRLLAIRQKGGASVPLFYLVLKRCFYFKHRHNENAESHRAWSRKKFSSPVFLCISVTLCFKFFNIIL